MAWQRGMGQVYADGSRHRAGTGMPTAAVTTRRRRLNVVKRSALTARAMPTAAPMPTGPVGVPRAVPTASYMPTAPSAYMYLCRRLFYAYGLPLAVGIAAFMPMGAVGKRSFSGSVWRANVLSKEEERHYCVGFDGLKFLQDSAATRGGHGERSTILSRADDASSVYLIHVEELQLCVWLHKGANWLVMDTICLRETCANLGMLDCDALPMINHVGDNSEFVFLRMGQCIFHMDIKCKTLCKLYEITNEDLCSSYIHPVVMIWPPTFPVLKNGPSRLSKEKYVPLGHQSN
ncbi:hypothetical protein VPH35_114572 [Triticum aestivum]